MYITNHLDYNSICTLTLYWAVLILPILDTSTFLFVIIEICLYESYLRGRLITTQGQTVQQVLRLQIPIIADNQPFDCTTFVWKSKLCMVLSCTCLGPRHSPYSYYSCRVSDIAAVVTTFNVYSSNAVWAEHRTHHLQNAEQIRYVLCHGRGLEIYLFIQLLYFHSKMS